LKALLIFYTPPNKKVNGATPICQDRFSFWDFLDFSGVIWERFICFSLMDETPEVMNIKQALETWAKPFL